MPWYRADPDELTHSEAKAVVELARSPNVYETSDRKLVVGMSGRPAGTLERDGNGFTAVTPEGEVVARNVGYTGGLQALALEVVRCEG